jgi:hypothetical protein
MKRILKNLGKGLVVLVFMLMCLLVATGAYIYYYQKQITPKAFQAVASALKLPIDAKHVEISLLKDFPRLSLVLHQVTIKDSADANNILVADKLGCVFNIVHFLKGQYILEYLFIKQGVLWAPTQKQATNNLKTVNMKADAHQSAVLNFPIHLKKLVLNDIKCIYTGKLPTEQTVIYAQQICAKFNLQNQHLLMQVSGQVVIEKVASKSITYTSTIPVYISTAIEYDAHQQIYSLNSGTIKQSNNTLYLRGIWAANAAKPSIDLQINAPHLSISKILPFIPAAYYSQIAPYQLQGKLACKLQFTQGNKTSIRADFKLDEGSFLPKSLKQSIQVENLVGKLNIPNIQELNTGTLQVDNYTIKLGPSQLTGSICLSDLEKLQVKNQSKIVMDFPTLVHALAPSSTIHPTGQLIGYWELDTSLNDILKPNAIHKLTSFKGQLSAQGVQFMHNQTLFQLQECVSLLLQDNVLHIKDVAGHIDGKPFVLAGAIDNWRSFLIDKQQKLHFNAKLYADYLALDKILLTKTQHNHKPVDWSWLTAYLKGELECDVEEVIYKRFRGNKVRGKFKITEQQLIVDAVELVFAGGKTRLSGTIDTKPDSLEIHTYANLQNVQLPALFYTFENFNQHFLEDRHLGGQVCSDIELTIQADKQLHLNIDSVKADIAIQLHNGVLQDFEPMQRLSPYVPEKDLRLLRFSSLKNNIHIKDKTIYVPPMEVHTSLTSIQLSGTHAFDGKIAYNLVVPLKNANPKEIRRQMPEINEEALAGLNLYLKLEGTTQNYALRYGNSLFKLNIKENIKRQGTILGNILQGNASPKRSKELSTDEYFDFE